MGLGSRAVPFLHTPLNVPYVPSVRIVCLRAHKLIPVVERETLSETRPSVECAARRDTER
jgi:hypothetical protein